MWVEPSMEEKLKFLQRYAIIQTERYVDYDGESWDDDDDSPDQLDSGLEEDRDAEPLEQFDECGMDIEYSDSREPMHIDDVDSEEETVSFT